MAQASDPSGATERRHPARGAPPRGRYGRRGLLGRELRAETSRTTGRGSSGRSRCILLSPLGLRGRDDVADGAAPVHPSCRDQARHRAVGAPNAGGPGGGRARGRGRRSASARGPCSRGETPRPGAGCGPRPGRSAHMTAPPRPPLSRPRGAGRHGPSPAPAARRSATMRAAPGSVTRSVTTTPGTPCPKTATCSPRWMLALRMAMRAMAPIRKRLPSSGSTRAGRMRAAAQSPGARCSARAAMCPGPPGRPRPWRPLPRPRRSAPPRSPWRT